MMTLATNCRSASKSTAAPRNTLGHTQSPGPPGVTGVAPELLRVRPRTEIPVATARPLSVLVVDDNEDAANSLGDLLRLLGHDVRVAYRGEDGWRAALARPPDCLILDIWMPDTDGYAVAARVRAEPTTRAVKLVAYTAFNDADHARRIKDAGFDHHLVKGADLAELQGVLEMIEQLKTLATTTAEVARQNVELTGQTRELLQEAKTEFRQTRNQIKLVAEVVEGVKEELKEVKDELREVKEELKETKQALGGESVG